MAETTTEKTWNPNTKRWDTREVYSKQEQGEYTKPLSSDAEAKRGVKVMFRKEEAAEQPKEDQSLGGAAARARKKREEAAKAEGQKIALSK